MRRLAWILGVLIVAGLIAWVIQTAVAMENQKRSCVERGMVHVDYNRWIRCVDFDDLEVP